MSPFTALVAVLLDQWLGEPRRAHPLVWFGDLASAVEARLNRGGGRVWRGLFAVLLLVVPAVAVAWWLGDRLGPWFDIPLLYLVIGGRSLADHALAVAAPLEAGDLAAARRRVARMVSRDTGEMDPGQVSAAAIESVLENGNDALFAPLFWFLVAGAPGALALRLVNTLDAMWGYRCDRFLAFGRAAARLDDLMNWLPARLTAVGYALAGDRRAAFRCWRRQARRQASPNGGVVMTAGAGALGLLLGGAARYHGQLRQKPRFGCGHPARPGDIFRAVTLVEGSLLLWLAALLPIGLVHG